MRRQLLATVAVMLIFGCGDSRQAAGGAPDSSPPAQVQEQRPPVVEPRKLAEKELAGPAGVVALDASKEDVRSAFPSPEGATVPSHLGLLKPLGGETWSWSTSDGEAFEAHFVQDKANVLLWQRSFDADEAIAFSESLRKTLPAPDQNKQTEAGGYYVWQGEGFLRTILHLEPGSFDKRAQVIHAIGDEVAMRKILMTSEELDKLLAAVNK